jgi:hypothetical protein
VCFIIIRAVGAQVGWGRRNRTVNIIATGCVGYVLGVVDGYNDAADHDFLCAPADSTAEQLGLVTLKYLHEHPEELHKPASDLIVKAVRAAFPCPKK